MTPKQTALFWLDAGIATIPLYHMSKVPTVKWTEYKTRLPALPEIDLWYQEPRNIAVMTGWQRLCVLDFDVIENYSAFFCWQLEHNPKILNTYRTFTNRGVHIFFYLKEDVKLNCVQSALFEVKTCGKLVTIPPSIHSSGKPYHTMDDPGNIQTVSIQEILNYSPVCFQSLVYPTLKSKYAPTSLPTQQDSIVSEIKAKISLLSFFPVTQQLDNEKRFYRTHCPVHGHKDNFWLDTKLGICGCYAGCCPTMDVITLFSKMNNLDIKQSIQELRRML